MTADLPHIEATRAALERLAALIKAGGTLAVVTFVKPSPETSCGTWQAGCRVA